MILHAAYFRSMCYVFYFILYILVSCAGMKYQCPRFGLCATFVSKYWH